MTTRYVAAIVVNWNGREDTLRCLSSLEQCVWTRLDVILVDNGSTDNTVAAVRAAFPAVEIIDLPTNRHFAAGANAGLLRGLEMGADYLWLLNNDVTVAPNALAEMVHLVESDPSVGVVGSRLIHPVDPPGTIVGANCDFLTGAIIEPPLPVESSQDRLVVDYVWGCSMLIRASLLRQIGIFDESYVAYFEDTDFCLRAKSAGWLTATALNAIVHHIGSKTANRKFLQQMWLRGRNWLRCFWRHAPPANRPRLLLWLLGYRLPHLVWSTGVTIVARTLRPKGRPIRLR